MPPVPAEQTDEPEALAAPELHPLWPVVLVLAEIAERVERRKAEELTVDAAKGPQHAATG